MFLPNKKEQSMTLRLGDTAPDFVQDSTAGSISFHAWAGDSGCGPPSKPDRCDDETTCEQGFDFAGAPAISQASCRAIQRAETQAPEQHGAIDQVITVGAPQRLLVTVVDVGDRTVVMLTYGTGFNADEFRNSTNAIRQLINTFRFD